MSFPKGENPYTRLLARIRAYAGKLKYLRTIAMFRYDTNDLERGASWKLKRLYERVAAAEQLGYKVYLEASAAGLEIFYVEKMPPVPDDWAY